MNLNDIKNPEVLKEMSIDELYALSDEIRQFLIHSISKTGGHLASNLGVVELTITLHYVFNAPEDKIFFDVGHQCYTHKILTGRSDKFDTLRQYKGLSGFQKRCESEYDCWEAGHSSTSLSAALGMAIARDMDHKHYQIIPVIGDGALSSGMSMEALNEIGSEKRNMIIVFNDNNMSINKNVGALNNSFSKLRASNGYQNLKNNMKKSLRTSDFGEAVYHSLKAVKDTIKKGIVQKGIFGDFNLDYIGPIDGHNIRDLIQVFEAVKDHEGPIVVHVITKKGKGYAPCEHDSEGRWHGVGPFNVETGKPLHEVPVGYAQTSFIASEKVRTLAEKNKDIVALTPAMMSGSSLQKFFAEFPDRSFDTGIAEEHAATLAASLALSGKRPYLCMYSSFLQRAYDQINHDICRMDLPVVIGVDHAGLVGNDGETHHGVFDVGLLTALPNMIVAQGKDAKEMENLIYTAFNQQHPFAFRYSKGIMKQADKHEDTIIPVGEWEVLHDADTNKVVIFTYGEDVDKFLDKVTVNDLPITIINCRYIKPLDESVLETFSKRKDIKYYCYESDVLEHGLGSMILEWMNDHNSLNSIKRFGIPDHYIEQGSEKLLRKELGVDLNTVMDCILSDLKH